MRRNQISAVHDCRCRPQKLQRRNLKGLPEAHRCQLHRPDILRLMYNARCLACKVNARFFGKTEFFHIFQKGLRPQSLPDLHKNRVAGILYPLYKAFRPMCARIAPAFNLSVPCHIKSAAEKAAFGCHSPLLQTCRGGHNFKRTPRLVCIIDCGLAPHFVQILIFLLLGKAVPFRRQCFILYGKRLIQIKRRVIRHGVNFPILRIQNDENTALCPLRFHRLCNGLLRILLHHHIHRCHQIFPIHRRNPFLFAVHLIPSGIRQRENLPPLPLQKPVIFCLQADNPLIILPDKANHLRRHARIGIDAPHILVHLYPRIVRPADGCRRFGVHLCFDAHQGNPLLDFFQNLVIFQIQHFCQKLRRFLFFLYLHGNHTHGVYRFRQSNPFPVSVKNRAALRRNQPVSGLLLIRQLLQFLRPKKLNKTQPPRQQQIPAHGTEQKKQKPFFCLYRRFLHTKHPCLFPLLIIV